MVALTRSGGSAAEKKSLFDTLVGTFVETSEEGYSVWLKIQNSSRDFAPLALFSLLPSSVWLAPLASPRRLCRREKILI